MRKLPGKLILLSALALLTTSSFSAIKKVTLFVNYGEGAILHPGAVESFKNTLTALATEKGFTLTISEQTNTAAQKAAALTNLKTTDIALFANIGLNSFQSVTDQTLLADYFMNGGKGIGYHASIDHHQYWKWWSDLHSGGTFQGHGSNPFKLTQDAEMKKIPALQKMWDDNALGDPNIASTEIYTLTSYPRGKEGVTMMQVVAPPNNAIPVHDFTWHKKIGSGQYIFTCLGHGTGDFTGGWLQKATWAWMEYLNGKYDPVTITKGELALKSNSVNFSGNQLQIRNLSSYALKVTNLKGETVFSKVGHGSQAYNLGVLKSGFYFVKLSGGTGVHSFKVLIK
jgi:type 1 glutamine amidotransferase